MELVVRLALPREAASVRVVRRILTHALRTLGVAAPCSADIELALSEACTNALVHTRDGTEYAVATRIDGDRCVIEVVDTGASFDATGLGLGAAAAYAERGRGIQLMRALVDDVRFERGAERGTIVHLEKTLDWSADAPARRLADGGPSARR